MKKLLPILLVILLLVQACSKDDETPGPSITIHVDGTSQPAKFSVAELLITQRNNFEGRTLSIAGMAGDDVFTISVSNWSFQNPPEEGVIVKKYENFYTESTMNKGDCSLDGTTQYCDGATVNYSSGDFYTSAGYHDASEGFVHITKCDVKNKRISGTYDVMLSDGANDISVKGEFKNIPYLVR